MVRGVLNVTKRIAMDLDEFKKKLFEALNRGELMTPKHDPNNLGKTAYASYRSVLSYDLADNLEEFIHSAKFGVRQYDNTHPRHHDEFYEIIPADTMFSIPASGVGPDEFQPNEALDRLVAVWNSGGTLHLFGESSTNIERREREGTLCLKKKL